MEMVSLLTRRLRFKNSLLYFLVLALGVMSNSCSMHWSKALSKGKRQKTDFREKVSAVNKTGLLFIPVVIEGREYLFLLDSGAPFSISKELQEELKYKRISSGKMRDTDNQLLKVNYVSVDEIRVGGVAFQEQTAFVANFDSNPILSCLNIDGIIGSNLMRFCNWEVDVQKEEIQLLSTLDSNDLRGYTSIPFRTDRQYNIYLDLIVDTLILRNITLDFGSNGSLSLPEPSFDALQWSESISAVAVEEGWSQSGLSGNRVVQTERIAILDSLSVGNVWFENLKVNSGSSSLLGLKALSNYSVMVDWQHQTLFLKKKTNEPIDHRSLGFTLGVLNDTSFYIQSVHKKSKAEELGLRPNLKVLSLNDLVFNKNAKFCDYVALMSSSPNELRIGFIDEQGNYRTLTLLREELIFVPIENQ